MENVVALLDVVSSPWQTVLRCIRAECNKFSSAVLEVIGYEGFVDGYVCLTVPYSFQESWLNTHYGILLRKTCVKVFGEEFKDYKVRLLLPSEKVPEITLKKPIYRSVSVKKPLVKKVIRKKLNLYANYTFENFIKGECNFTALHACESVAENPGDKGMNPLLIYGASGLGKTHLLQSIAAKLQTSKNDYRIVYRQAYDFLRDSVAIGEASFAGKKDLYESLKENFIENYANCDVLLIDDIQLLEKAKKSQEKLALLIKALRSQGKQVVLTCDRKPSAFKKLEANEPTPSGARIPQLSANLLSHLESCVAVGLTEPDLNTRMNLIRKKSENLPFYPEDRDEICRFLSIPPRANIRLIEGVLTWLKALHTLNGIELNLSCIKQLLVNPQNDGATLTLKNISETVAATFKIDTVVLSSKRQDKGASIPRKVAMYLCRELTCESLIEVGKIFNRDYASVIAAINSLHVLMNNDENLKRRVQDIRYMLEIK